MRNEREKLTSQQMTLLKVIAIALTSLLLHGCPNTSGPNGETANLFNSAKCNSLASYTDVNGQNILNSACDGPASQNQNRIPQAGRVVEAATSGEAITEPCHECDPIGDARVESRPSNATRYQARDVAPNRACDIPGMSAKAKKNCSQLLEDGEVPKNAFLFTLDGLKRNASSFKTNKCHRNYRSSGGSTLNNMQGSHHSMQGTNDPRRVEQNIANGIPNKCTMIINNHDEKIPGKDCRVRMYYINLCGDGPEVTKTESNVGTGTCRKGRGYQNASGRHTTVLGFGVTGGEKFAFQPHKYRGLKATPVFGLQSNNNGSGVDAKYLHTTDFISSHGCPSVERGNEYIIDEMTRNGPSVIVAYKEGKMESFEDCE